MTRCCSAFFRPPTTCGLNTRDSVPQIVSCTRCAALSPPHTTALECTYSYRAGCTYIVAQMSGGVCQSWQANFATDFCRSSQDGNRIVCATNKGDRRQAGGRSVTNRILPVTAPSVSLQTIGKPRFRVAYEPHDPRSGDVQLRCVNAIPQSGGLSTRANAKSRPQPPLPMPTRSPASVATSTMRRAVHPRPLRAARTTNPTPAISRRCGPLRPRGRRIARSSSGRH
jgi:hypothetical protein